MLYSRAANLAYFHIHKTGGKSFRAFFLSAFPDAVEIGNRTHETLQQAFAMLTREGINPREVRVITSIRDPFAHVVSVYHFWRSLRTELSVEYVQAAKRLPFHEFVNYYCAASGGLKNLLEVDGAVPPNVCVIRLERAEEELDFYLNRVLKLGVAVSLPILNRSAHGSVDSYYDTASKELVARRYAWVFRQGWYPLSEAHQSMAAARRAAAIAVQEARALRHSVSYRIGRALSWPVRGLLSQMATWSRPAFPPVLGWALGRLTTPVVRLKLKDLARAALQ